MYETIELFDEESLILKEVLLSCLFDTLKEKIITSLEL
jgi:hypothetical protein